MSDEYWYRVGEQRRGPVSLAQLKMLFTAKIINAQTQIWSADLKTWTQIGHADFVMKLVKPAAAADLQANSEAGTSESKPRAGRVNSPTKNRVAIDLSDYDDANRWRRFFARTFDQAVFSFPAAFVIKAFVVPLAKFMGDLQSTLLFLIVLALFLVLTLVFEAIFYALFSTTPGKALLDVRVIGQDDQALDTRQYTNRLVRLFVSGYGLGLGPTSLLAGLYQSSRIHRGLNATYDAETTRVIARPTLWARAVVAAVVILMGPGYLSHVMGDGSGAGSSQAQARAFASEATAANFLPATTWRIPGTASTIPLSSGWYLRTTNHAEGVNETNMAYANERAKRNSPGYAMVNVARFQLPAGIKLEALIQELITQGRDGTVYSGQAYDSQFGSQVFKTFDGKANLKREFAVRTYVAEGAGWVWMITALVGQKEHFEAPEIKGVYSSVLGAVGGNSR